MNLITVKDEKYLSFLCKIEEMENTVSRILENSNLSSFDEKYLTDRELSKMLNISRRTLQQYRSQGKIPYYMIGGKILYKESDIENLMKENFYRKLDNF